MADRIVIREIEPADADECARIVYEAFAGIHDHHRFPRDFPTVNSAAQLTGALIGHPQIWGVVAESDGRLVGSNFLDQRGPIAGVGPITIEPAFQGRGAGRRLMQAVIDRGSAARGIRLFQDAFSMQSLALYASLGFEVREPAVVMTGTPRSGPPSGIAIRPLDQNDVDECERLCVSVHGFDRTAELRDAIGMPTISPVVAVRDGRITAYATTVATVEMSYGVAETEEDLCALIAGAVHASETPASLIVPVRETTLFRWCLTEGLLPLKPVTYMTFGEYRDPAGGWIPSILY